MKKLTKYFVGTRCISKSPLLNPTDLSKRSVDKTVLFLTRRNVSESSAIFPNRERERERERERMYSRSVGESEKSLEILFLVGGGGRRETRERKHRFVRRLRGFAFSEDVKMVRNDLRQGPRYFELN
jgi:hypothetical protein